MTTFPDAPVSEEKIKSAKLKGILELAFVGDAVFELLVRDYISSNIDTGPGKLHTLAVGYVRAEAQARFLELLMPRLTEEEADVVRRGKNATKVSVPKHADPRDYRFATALEALFGHLFFLGQHGRIAELFGIIIDENPINK